MRLIKLPFVQTQTKDSFFFVQTQTKDNFFSSRLRRKTTYFHPDSDERQLPFVKTQKKNNFFLSRLRQETASFRLDFDKIQYSFVWTKTRNCSFSSKVKTHLPLVEILTNLCRKRQHLLSRFKRKNSNFGTLLLVENCLYDFYQRYVCVIHCVYMPKYKWFWWFRRHICQYISDSDDLEGIYAYI